MRRIDAYDPGDYRMAEAKARTISSPSMDFSALFVVALCEIPAGPFRRRGKAQWKRIAAASR